MSGGAATVGQSLYRTRGWWRVSWTLGSGKMGDCGLRCKAGKDSLPPQRGWQYENYGKWSEDDPSLQLFPGPLSPCSSVSVTSSGRAARELPGSLGVFTVLEGKYAEGRQVPAVVYTTMQQVLAIHRYFITKLNVVIKYLLYCTIVMTYLGYPGTCCIALY